MIFSSSGPSKGRRDQRVRREEYWTPAPLLATPAPIRHRQDMPAPLPARLLLALAKRVGVIVLAVNLAIPAMVALLPATTSTARETTPERELIAKKASARYRASRDTMIDLLLPEGAGGTNIAGTLGPDHDGEAFPDRAEIKIVADAVLDSVARMGTRRGDQVELHERAHLLDANHPDLVLALLRKLPAPDPEEYAAKDGGEHFAEMIAKGWAILELQQAAGFCPDLVGAMRHEEQRVPGTAGAVAWIAPTWSRVRGQPIDSMLRREVDSLLSPTQAEWRAIAGAVEARRQANGHLAVWPALNGAAKLRRARAALLQDPSLTRRTVGVILWPATAAWSWLSTSR